MSSIKIPQAGEQENLNLWLTHYNNLIMIYYCHLSSISIQYLCNINKRIPRKIKEGEQWTYQK